jgi:hypothetical protein
MATIKPSLLIARAPIESAREPVTHEALKRIVFPFRTTDT